MMIKIFTYIFATITLLTISVSCSYAQEVTMSESGTLAATQTLTSQSFDYRVSNLRSFFTKYNSPLVSHAEDFVSYADIYGIDYRLVPAISGVESTFGKHIPYKSYNAYGWANGEYRFTSWEDSIEHVSMTLKTKYIDRGAPSITKIAKRYAPPSTTWGKNVTSFVSKIDTLPLTFDI